MFKYFNRAMKVMNILGNTIPKALEDGQITVAECVEVVRQLFDVFEVKSFEVPEKIQEVAIKVDEYYPDPIE